MVMRTPDEGSASLIPSSPTGRTIRESLCGARLAPSRMHRAESLPRPSVPGTSSGTIGSSNSVPRCRLGRRKTLLSDESRRSQGAHRGELVGDRLGVGSPVDAGQERVAAPPHPAYGGECGLGVDLGLEHVGVQQVEQLVALADLPLLHEPEGTSLPER